METATNLKRDIEIALGEGSLYPSPVVKRSAHRRRDRGVDDEQGARRF